MTGYEFILWVLGILCGTFVTLFVTGATIEYTRHHRKDKDNDAPLS